MTSAAESRPWWVRHRWALTVLGLLLFVVNRMMVADYWDNERVYAIGALKLIDGDFLAGDPFWGTAFPYFLVLDTISVPFYLAFGALGATLILRVLIWVFQIWALSRLVRALGLHWWAFAAAVVAWLSVEQTLMAGDWIIGCTSGKPVAYGFVFLALEARLRDRSLRSGVFAGLAGTFHVIAGFWAALALLATFLVDLRAPTFRRDLFAFCASSFVCVLPGAVPAVWGELLRPDAGAVARDEVARLSVTLANPFHLDPSYFGSPLEYLKGVLILAGALALAGCFRASTRGVVRVFLVALAASFLLGLGARVLESWSFLKYYPFRVADSFIPLLFWLGVGAGVQALMHRSRRAGLAVILLFPLEIATVNYLVDRCEPDPRFAGGPAGWVEALDRTEPKMSGYWFRERTAEWWRFLNGRAENDFDEVAGWIRENTAHDSMFLAPPYEPFFTLKARRPQVVAFCIPVTGRIYDWLDRIEAANGGPLRSVGFEMWHELAENYRKLTLPEIIRIRERWGADYLLTTSDAELDLEPVYTNASYSVYRLQDVQGSDG